MIESTAIFFTGLTAGIIHVLIGPDHLAAVAPFTTERKKAHWLTGLWWGIGHSGGVWMIGILVFLLRDMLPLETLSSWSERFVGVVLIGLGIWAIHRALRSRAHFHHHSHDGRQHAHFHLHGRDAAQDHQATSGHQHSHAPLGIGLLHGLAGSSHLLGILPALALTTLSAVAYVAGFGLGAILAMTCFSWALGRFIHRLENWSNRAFRWLQLSFAGFAISIGIAWLAMG
jgi:ABC-type nickel/cobalt efflux system permease component RcnA